MRAVYFTEHGGIEKLTYGELPDPVPTGAEVVLSVKACAVNYTDLWTRKGLPFYGPTKFPHIPGLDIAGEVVAVGPSVRSIQVGMRAVLNPGISCGHCQYCLTGRDNFCPQYHMLGVDLPGGYAQLIKVPAANVVPLPSDIAWESAACLPVAFITAWAMLFEKAQLRPSEWVLIHAAGSGVGSAAIQLAHLAGAHIITTAGSSAKLEKATALGAHYFINYNAQDFLREVRRITAKRGVDVVIEHIGQAVFERSLLCLAPGGRLITCGGTSGYEAKMDLRYVFFREIQILGTKLGSKGALFRIVNLLQAGKLQPVIDRVLPLKEVRQAHQLLEERRQFGKIVLIPE